MEKKVFRYFLDFTQGQETWLNEMSQKGWRLKKCGQLSYTFENCDPGEYEYAVEFVGYLSDTKSKSYKQFLDEMGYRTIYKNVNVGIYVGKVKWRPWAEGAGQIATAPGNILKELIIVEKRKDGTLFELHTDLSDQIETLRKISTPYYFSAGMFFLAAWICGVLALSIQAFAFLFGILPFLLLSCLCYFPARSITKRRNRLLQETKVNEHDSIRKGKGKIVLLILLPILILASIFGGMYLADIPFNSYTMRMAVTSTGKAFWKSEYRYFDGIRYHQVTLEPGNHTIHVNVTTKSGTITFTVMGKADDTYFTQTIAESTDFDFVIETTEKEKITLSMEAQKHEGSFHVTWE
ncbi:MAG: DUF2812 domain-containing protein [Lachnospiraceae bacterium]|jgi:hypothetical protein|nr:DUF2812 domain-containing protein [Lachnospiraceae bacterium]